MSKKDEQSPSWIVYKQYFERRAKGQNPSHLFDGYQENLNINTSSKDVTADLDKNQTQSDISQGETVPHDLVRIVSKQQDNLEKAVSSLEREKIEDSQLKHTKDNLPPEGLTDIESQFNAAVESDISEDTLVTPPKSLATSEKPPFIQKTIKTARKRKSNISLSDIRDRLTHSPSWQNKQKKRKDSN